MSSFTSHSRMPALLRVFAIVALVTGSFVAVAQAHEGKGGGHGRPGDDPSASPTDASTDDGHGRGHGRGGGGKREGRPAPTRMKLRLTSHHVETGSDVLGTVGLQTRAGNKWAPLAGEVAVFVDRTEVLKVTTSATDGKAPIVVAGLADGGHVLGVGYAGDATHRPARHRQGFYVGTPPECEDDADDEASADEIDDDDVRARDRGPGRGDKDKRREPKCPEGDDSTTTDDDAAKEEDDEEGDDEDDDNDGVDTTGDDSQTSGADGTDTTGDTGTDTGGDDTDGDDTTIG